MADETTIPVKKDTRRRLKVHAAENGLTYDELLNDMLDFMEAIEESEEQIEKGDYFGLEDV